VKTESRSYVFARYQLPAILWACLIFAASSVASSQIPDLSIFRFDKVIHFGIYFILALLIYRAFRNQDRFPALARHALLFTLAAIVLYGASDEFHQSFVPGRDCDIFDLLADAAGGVMLIALVWIKERFFTDSHPN
jgi:VanZ family protein